MSEVNLTLTAKPFTVSTRVKWAQNATILHYVEAKCEMHRGSLITVFVRRSEKLDRSVSVQLDTNEPGRYMRNLSKHRALHPLSLSLFLPLDSRSNIAYKSKCICIVMYVLYRGIYTSWKFWKFLDLTIELYYSINFYFSVFISIHIGIFEDVIYGSWKFLDLNCIIIL